MALYDFDPSTIKWPFPDQQPLPLKTGDVIEVMGDPSVDWPLGHLVGQPNKKGFFPKNYTVNLHTYHEDARQAYFEKLAKQSSKTFAGFLMGLVRKCWRGLKASPRKNFKDRCVGCLGLLSFINGPIEKLVATCKRSLAD